MSIAETLKAIVLVELLVCIELARYLVVGLGRFGDYCYKGRDRQNKISKLGWTEQDCSDTNVVTHHKI